MQNKYKERRGFTLVIVLIGLALMSILGVSIIGATTSTYKMTKVDSKSQSAFYIAEAGINKAIDNIKQEVNKLSEDSLTNESFFQKLEEYLNMHIDNFVFQEFESVFNHNPTATLNVVKGNITDVSDASSTQRIITYVINSKGQIGNRSRTVNVSIDVLHKVEINNNKEHHPAFDYAIYSPQSLSLPHNSKISGSIYSKDIIFKTAGTQISGDVISETFIDIPGDGSHPKIGGSLYALSGYAKVASGGGNATVAGNVNANGNVTIGSHGNVKKSVFSSGNILLQPANAKILGNANAQGSITLSSGTLIAGSAYLNKDLTMLNSNSEVQGDVFAGNNIYKENNTNIRGYSQAGGNKNEHNKLETNRNILISNKPKNPTFSVSNIILPPSLNNFTSDKSKPINVPQSSSNYIIEPGTYGDLYVGGASTILFKSGTYIFNSIDGARWGQNIRLDLSQGPIKIFSVEDIKYSGKIQVTEDGKKWFELDKLDDETAVMLAGKVYWETRENFILTNAVYSSQWFGSVLANKDFIVGGEVKLIGAYVTNKGKFTFGVTPEIIYAPPEGFLSVGSEEVANVAGTNNIVPENRVKISNSIREK